MLSKIYEYRDTFSCVFKIHQGIGNHFYQISMGHESVKEVTATTSSSWEAPIAVNWFIEYNPWNLHAVLLRLFCCDGIINDL